MNGMRKASGRATSMPAGLAIGALWSAAVTLALAAILAKLVENEVMPEESIGYGVMVILVLASFLGAMVTVNKVKHQRLMMCLASGAVYFGILLATTALFFGGQYTAVGETALMIVCGCGLVIVLDFQQNRGGKKPKIRVPNR